MTQHERIEQAAVLILVVVEVGLGDKRTGGTTMKRKS